MSAPETAPDLDLRPYLPERFRITGATGREYVVTSWLPMAIAIRIEQLIDRVSASGAEAVRANPDEYDWVLDDSRELAFELLQRSYPDITAEQVNEDFPGEAAVTFLGFLLRKWVQMRMVPLQQNQATTTEKGEAVTPKPRPISESEIERALTGSKSSPTSSSEATDQ